MLTLDDVESDTVKRFTFTWFGAGIFYTIVEGTIIAFDITHNTHTFIGDPQALWRGYLLISSPLLS